MFLYIYIYIGNTHLFIEERNFFLYRSSILIDTISWGSDDSLN